MISRAELKMQAKEQMKGNLGMIVLGGIIYFAIVLVFSFIPYIGTIGSIIVAPPLMLGLYKMFLNVTYGDKAEVSTIFEPFQTCFASSVILNLLVGIFTFLWSLLLIIPGIIKSYAYSMSFYILAENPNMSASDAITESKTIMDGHKMDLFVLMLSFFPWIVLCVFTFGLGYIFVLPYMQLTMTNFYHNVKRQSKPAIEENAYVVE